MKKIIAMFLAAAAVNVSAADLTGAGATFPFPIYSKWAEAYKAATGIGLNYQSIGSGGGIKQIKAKKKNWTKKVLYNSQQSSVV